MRLWLDYALIVVDDLANLGKVPLPDRPFMLPSEEALWQSVKAWKRLGASTPADTKAVVDDLQAWKSLSKKAEDTLANRLYTLLGALWDLQRCEFDEAPAITIRLRTFILEEHGIELPKVLTQNARDYSLLLVGARSKVPAHWQTMTCPPEVFDPEEM